MEDTRQYVIEALEDGPVKGPELASELGISRMAVWKHVEALREAGFAVEATDEGYSVTAVPEFGGLAIEFGLNTSFEIEFHHEIDSTNDRGRELAESGADDVVVLADAQTHGRGRLSRTWSSPSGGVWMSLVCRPKVTPDRVSLLTFAVAVAVTDSLRSEGVDAAIKWPNDVIVPDAGDLKIAGILTEMGSEAGRVSWVVIGTGVNANVASEELPPGATSAMAEVGPIDRRAIVQEILETFDDLRDDPEATIDRWRAQSDTLDRTVRVQTRTNSIEGTAVDVTSIGELVVETRDGRVTIHTGDCEHLRRLQSG